MRSTFESMAAFQAAIPSPDLRDRLESSAYPSKFTNRYIFPVDKAAFVNHSLEPSAAMVAAEAVPAEQADCWHGADQIEGALVTLRDMAAGDELTENYCLDFGDMDLSNPRDAYLRTDGHV